MGAWANPKACYVWGLVYHANGSERYQDVGLVKVDMCVEGEDEATVTVYQRNNQFTGEPIFVKDPKGTREDDGTLLVVSRDADSDETALLVRGVLEQPGLSVVRSPNPTTALLAFPFLYPLNPDSNPRLRLLMRARWRWWRGWWRLSPLLLSFTGASSLLRRGDEPPAR